MTLLGTAESCPDTILTAVRSSIESPNEIISRRRVTGTLSTGLVLSSFLLHDIAPESSAPSRDEFEPTEDSSVETKLSQDVFIGSESLPRALSPTLSSSSTKCSFTSCANAAAFQHKGWPG
eukprot:CAMPEP_0185726058 /NCGR_PEP_ID=MMETSP1171-20130828/2147_1 /TAXON_ID=374046 /ORGANISM="Helicotheca tamensis, Strain CCMP826" /LENGTH=120 /DNA_ID=CAMNT_0028394335 /DNA_START=406 /DNA_END=768 /DNA_ORIENTATION=-